MSDCITKIIPVSPYSHIAPQIVQEAEKYLAANFSAEDITSVLYDTPAFIDCGGNLEEIKCPICGAALDFDWWGEVMDKATRKGRTKAEVDEVICWLTGYSPEQIEAFRSADLCYGDFFRSAPQPNPNRALIKGVVCGVRVEEVEDPLMREIRRLDKLIDELAKGKPMEKILRK